MVVAVQAARKGVDPGTERMLRKAYASLWKAGHNSVRAAWRFGQVLDGFSDRQTGYTQAQLADVLGLSTGTVYKYRRFYGAYQTPELAVQASDELETYDIGVLIALRDQFGPVEHGRPLAGRHWRYTCTKCASTEVRRVEIDDDGLPLDEEALVPAGV